MTRIRKKNCQEEKKKEEKREGRRKKDRGLSISFFSVQVNSSSRSTSEILVFLPSHFLQEREKKKKKEKRMKKMLKRCFSLLESLWVSSCYIQVFLSLLLSSFSLLSLLERKKMFSPEEKSHFKHPYDLWLSCQLFILFLLLLSLFLFCFRSIDLGKKMKMTVEENGMSIVRKTRKWRRNQLRKKEEERGKEQKK